MLTRANCRISPRLRRRGGYARVATTYPAQTPVAWSTFATGTNPGGHGIFDFIRRDPRTYLPDLALNRYEQSRFAAPRAVNSAPRHTGVGAPVGGRCPVHGSALPMHLSAGQHSRQDAVRHGRA